MGNCQTCDKLDRKGDVLLEAVTEADRPTETEFEELAKVCPEVVRELYLKLGEFPYSESYPYEWKPPTEMDHGLVYYGQWKDGKRWGRGKQLWKEGTLYEGYWQNDMANGEGRLIQHTGEVYEG